MSDFCHFRELAAPLNIIAAPSSSAAQQSVLRPPLHTDRYIIYVTIIIIIVQLAVAWCDVDDGDVALSDLLYVGVGYLESYYRGNRERCGGSV